ncbi:sulfite exporter TauE/SafE family protein [Pueribacillus sp. YX66]|uniref:urease accessory protein UreH domain-containing protein n=1 Tax=Pueribacillus sp. YX66 TaxID=3229242 RepID=UPI00358D1017
MYDFFNYISQFLYGPLTNLANNTQHIPLAAAFFLGLLGAAAPCQFTGNLGAITYYGNRSFNKGITWSEVIFYLLGKIVVFSGLGFVVWLLGKEFQRELTAYFPLVRKLLGPILILMGIYLLGFFKMKWNLSLGKISEKYFKNGNLGAFLLGFSFSLGFCPTMFGLFFFLLMPLVLSSSYGIVLPTIFAIGTSVPFLIAMFIVWYYGLNGKFMKGGRKIGLFIQRFAGLLMVVVGFFDSITYWAV